jgi:hypothetical protein
MRRLLVLGAAVAAVGLVAGTGLAGGPAPGVMVAGGGVVAPGGAVRYVAYTRGAGTVVTAVLTASGRTARWGWLKGSYGVPMIAFDGTTDGLTSDGKTLVLASPPYTGPPPYSAAVSHFAILDTRTLRLRTAVSLRGMFAYDAISPDAKTLYLIEYMQDSDQIRYRVRAYDLAAHRLLRRVVADPQEWADSMVGSPIARATGPGGRWVYTLYANPGAPFIHALNAVQRKAVCIDLPWRGSDEWLTKMQLTLNGNATRLVVHPRGGNAVLVVNTKTLRVLP